MQATVRSYDHASRTGTVLRDDGTVLEFGAAAFGSSGLLRLRPGQRVAIRCGGDGLITALTLATFPLPGEDAAGRTESGAR